MSTGESEPEDGIRLRTARLMLRAPEQTDAGVVAALCNNPKIALQTARVPYPYAESDAQAWIGQARASTSDGETFLITQGEGGDVLGAVGYGRMEGAEPEIGYWIGEPYWGQGYATEAVQAVIDHAFSSTDLPQLSGRCRVGNIGSRRVLEKCGFQYRAAGMVQSRALRGWVPTEDFCLERFVWKSLKRWGGQRSCA